jgi:hypothetical protein
LSRITRIVIHCSDSPDTMNIGAEEIRKWHMDPPPKGRGWSDIGYHYVVTRSGTIEAGRYHDGDSILEGSEIGAHVAGQNKDSLAICWVGRTKPSAAQYQSLIVLVCLLCASHGVALEGVYGHGQGPPGHRSFARMAGNARLGLQARCSWCTSGRAVPSAAGGPATPSPALERL